MGRGPFFGGSRKIRGFAMNLSPGIDDAHPGDPFFPYSKFEFPYSNAPAGFHHEFFSQHHGPGNLPFNPAGSMDGSMVPLGNDFNNSMGPEPPQGFMGQQPPPPAHSETQLISQRSSPDFMSSQGGGSASSGGFSDVPHSEQLVW